MGEVIKTHSQLVDVYQSSLISVNIPQIQTGPALPYRVFDILASDSLLITKYHSESDAFSLFGKDCPIPMYRDMDHLRELCAFYLSNDEARRELVAKCNGLVAKGYSFDERVLSLAKLTGVTVSPTNVPGQVLFVDYTRFDKWYKQFTIGDWKRSVRLSFLWMMRTLTNAKIRKKLIRVFEEADESKQVR